MIAERYKRQQRMKGREEGREELARRLLTMSDAEAKSEIERIANGGK